MSHAHFKPLSDGFNDNMLKKIERNRANPSRRPFGDKAKLVRGGSLHHREVLARLLLDWNR